MGGFSFISPLALGILALSPLLLLAYLNRSPLRTRIVSSLILLRELPKSPAIRDRIKLPWRFFLEALILLLLGILAAYPKFVGKGERVALILDNSLSMNALEAEGKRFELAKKELRAWLDLQSSKDRFTLFLSSPKLTKVTGELVDVGAVLSGLDELKPNSSPDFLDGGLSQVVSSGEFDRAFVVSDKRANFSATASSKTFPVDARVVGNPVANVAIVNLRLERQKEKGVVVVASLAAFGGKATQVRLRAIAGGGVLAEGNVQLDPKRIVEARLAIARQTAEIVRVEIIPTELSLDSITFDDIGYIDLGKSVAKNILLVTDSPIDDTALGLAPLGTEGVSSAGFTALTEEEVAEFRAIVFHGLLPRTLPKVPTLAISPPLQNTVFPGAREVSSPSISSWKTENQLTSYLNFGLLKIGKTMIFTPPIWSESVVSVEEGPVVISGEENGTRRAAVGFEILPFEGRRTPTLSVFTLNILSWLSGGAQFEETLRTGSMLPVSGKYEVIFPGGRVLKSDEVKTSDGPLRADIAGLYRLKLETGERKIVINPFHPEESATNETGFFEATLQALEDRESESFLWRDILFGVIALLALDIVLRAAFLLRGRNGA